MKTSQRRIFYDTIAEDFDSVMNRYEVEKRLDIVFNRLLPTNLAGLSVLDAGCGTGLFSQEAGRQGAEVFALDIGRKLLKQTAKRCSHARLIQGDLQSIGAAQASFDVVICTEAIEHTFMPRQSLRELVRVLKPGGLLVLTVPNRVWHFSVVVSNALGVRPYRGYENWVGWKEIQGWLTQLNMELELMLGFNLLPLFQPVFHPLLNLADRHAGALQPFMVNIGLRARKLLV